VNRKSLIYVIIKISINETQKGAGAKRLNLRYSGEVLRIPTGSISNDQIYA